MKATEFLNKLNISQLKKLIDLVQLRRKSHNIIISFYDQFFIAIHPSPPKDFDSISQIDPLPLDTNYCYPCLVNPKDILNDPSLINKTIHYLCTINAVQYYQCGNYCNRNTSK